MHYWYNVQIDDRPAQSNSLEDNTQLTGTLYSLTKPLAAGVAEAEPVWNEIKITLDGLRTVVTVNAVKVTDYQEGDPTPPRKFDFEPHRGWRPVLVYFGMQNHSEKDVLFFNSVAIRPLKT